MLHVIVTDECCASSFCPGDTPCNYFRKENTQMDTITLFKSITVFCGTDSIMQNISSFMLNVRNILHNIVSPAKYCGGSYAIPFPPGSNIGRPRPPPRPCPSAPIPMGFGWAWVGMAAILLGVVGMGSIL